EVIVDLAQWHTGNIGHVPRRKAGIAVLSQHLFCRFEQARAGLYLLCRCARHADSSLLVSTNRPPRDYLRLRPPAATSANVQLFASAAGSALRLAPDTGGIGRRRLRSYRALRDRCRSECSRWSQPRTTSDPPSWLASPRIPTGSPDRVDGGRS